MAGVAGGGASDGFGAYGMAAGSADVKVGPCCIVFKHEHVVGIKFNPRLTLCPVCERAVFVH